MSQHEMSFTVSQDLETVMAAMRQTAAELSLGVIESGTNNITVKTLATLNRNSIRIDFKVNENSGTNISAHGSLFGLGPYIQRQLQAEMGGFINALSVKLAAPSQSGTSSVNNDLASQLEQLARLRDQGVLTPEEFETSKKRVLGL